MVEEMIVTITSNRQRLEVWKWVFDKERGHDDDAAMKALTFALSIVSNDANKSNTNTDKDSDIIITRY